MARIRGRSYPWARLPEQDLLDLRLRDLGLVIEGTWLEDAVGQLYQELQNRGITLRPHVWLSDEFFSPTDIPGIGIPFYLAHPRLIRLERKKMLEVEGGTWESLMRILRHEAGHAVQHAYQVQRKRAWQRMFGKSSTAYPDFYVPRPRSRRYVQHLDYWYAQSHPDEDFAETFAVWLAPRSNWRKRYAGWPAIKKLEYVDELISEHVAGERPIETSRRRIDSLPRLRKTLRDYYDAKWERHGADHPDVYDRDLRRIFSDDPKFRRNEAASSFLRRVRAEIRRDVAKWTGENEFSLDLVFRDMIGRCRELKLRVAGPQRQLKRDFTILLTMQTMNYLFKGHYAHPL